MDHGRKPQAHEVEQLAITERPSKLYPSPKIEALPSSVFALGASVAAQFALLASGVGTAWLLGDVGRGILAYGAVIGTLCGTLASGGLQSSSAVAIHGYQNEEQASFLSHLTKIGIRRGVIAAAVSVLILVAFRSEIGSAVVPLSIGTAAAAFGLVRLQAGTGTLQGLGKVNSANAYRLIPSVVYAIGVLATVAFLRGSDRPTLTLVALAWAAGWILVAAVPTQRALRGAFEKSVLSHSERSRFSRLERAHFLSSLSTYEVLRFDHLAAALLISTADLGVYSVAMSFTGLLKAMATSFGVASLGDSLAEMSNRSLLRTVGSRAAVVLIAAVALILVIPFAIDAILPPVFSSAVTPSRLLVTAAAFAAIRRSLVEMAKGLDLVRVGSVTEVAQVAIFVILSLVAERTASGVALAIAVAMAISCLATTIWVIRERST